MSKHENNGACPRCIEFLTNAHPVLQDWLKAEQALDPELHCSDTYRGKVDQERDFDTKHSKAHFGQSPHNYNPAAALDTFYIDSHGVASWPVPKYEAMAKRKPHNMEWGGDWNDNGLMSDEKFKDCPHFQLKDWKHVVSNFPSGNE